MSDTSFPSIAASLQRALPAAARRWLLKRGPLLVFLGLLALFAWMAAKVTWGFLSPSTPVAAAPSAATPTQAVRQVSSEQIAAAHLFGVSAAATAGAATGAGAENAPETTLNLQLVGVAAGRDGATSQAIISSGSHGEETTYAVGATLPGGAIIREILPDRVIIAHSGRLEALRLPVVGTSILAASLSFGTGGGGAFGNLPGVTVEGPGANFASETVGKQITAHPETVTRYLRWHPYTQNGQQQGVMVDPGANPVVFERSGLQPGDIITSVNGIKLDNARSVIRGMSSLRGTAHLVVLRQGKQVPLTVDFSKLNPGG